MAAKPRAPFSGGRRLAHYAQLRFALTVTVSRYRNSRDLTA